MLCQKCGLTEAIVHRETVVYRQKVEEHLCDLCSGSGILAKPMVWSLSSGFAGPESVETDYAVPPDSKRPKELRLPDRITVRMLADLLCIKPFKACSILMHFGIFSPLSQEIDFSTAEKLCMHCGVVPIKSNDRTA